MASVCIRVREHEQVKTLEFHLVSYGSTGSFSHCETGEHIFVNAYEKPCCHTKHRNFPPLTSAFRACVFPSYDPSSLMLLSCSWTFHRGVAWIGRNVIFLNYRDQHPTKAVINEHSHRLECAYSVYLSDLSPCVMFGMFTWQQAQTHLT